MNQMIQPHVVFRLVLARKIFRDALRLCKDTGDIYGFSHGLISLHNALDNFTGAILTQLGIPLQKGNKNNLMNAIAKIQAYEKKSNENFILISESEISQLNEVRNNIKHSGIMPNASQITGLIVPIRTFFKKYSLQYFGLEWESISLAELIKDDAIKGAVKNVENLIEKENFEEALEAMAIIKFKVFDELSLRITLDPKYDFYPPSDEIKKKRASTNIFPNQDRDLFSDLYDRTDFLEKGINIGLMGEFESLTAKVGVNNSKDWKYIVSHGNNWAQANWTKQNTLFCYEFLLDAILKNQRREHDFNNEFVWTSYRIRARGEISIYDKNGKVIYTIAKGEERDAFIDGRVEGIWEIYGDGDLFLRLQEEEKRGDIIGFLQQKDKDKIEFLETRQYIRGNDGKLVLNNQRSKG